MESRKGQKLGHYYLLERLGQGGFASVYRARDLHLQRIVAIKVLKSMVDSPTSREAFLREARAVAGLKHSNIVQVLEFDVQDNIPFLVMDFAPGGSLRFPEGLQLPLAKIIPYIQQVAEALDYAHSKGLIHRDVKPENMLLGSHGEVLLSDFGLVQMAQHSSQQVTGDMAGTPRYMAPEQALGKACFASDQYALGIVVYEWLTGRVPFQGDSPLAIAYQHMRVAPPSLRLRNPHVSPALDHAVLKALSKDPTQRFDTVSEFAEAVAKASQLVRYASLSPSQQVEDGEAFISTLIKPRQQEVEMTSLFEQEDDDLSLGTQTQQADLRKTRAFLSGLSPHSPLSSRRGIEADFSTIPAANWDSLGRSLQEERPDYLRWLILGCAVASILLSPAGFLFQQPPIWVVGIILAAASALLGVLQAIQRDQWFWFIGFLCLSPLAGLFYGILHPNKKANPPASMRQLILVTGCMGLLFLVSGLLVLFISSNTLAGLEVILVLGGLDLSLNHWLLAWIRSKRLGEDTTVFAYSIPYAGPLWIGLASIWNDNRDL
jgi:serine/threonine protein kinase